MTNFIKKLEDEIKEAGDAYKNIGTAAQQVVAAGEGVRLAVRQSILESIAAGAAQVARAQIEVALNVASALPLGDDSAEADQVCELVDLAGALAALLLPAGVTLTVIGGPAAAALATAAATGSAPVPGAVQAAAGAAAAVGIASSLGLIVLLAPPVEQIKSDLAAIKTVTENGTTRPITLLELLQEILALPAALVSEFTQLITKLATYLSGKAGGALNKTAAQVRALADSISQFITQLGVNHPILKLLLAPIVAIYDAARRGVQRVLDQIKLVIDRLCDKQPRDGLRNRKRHTDTIDLDREYPSVAPESWLALALPTEPETIRAVFQVAQVAEAARAEYTLNGKVTRVRLQGKPQALAAFEPQVRDTLVLAQSERLALAEEPLSAPVYGRRIVLDALVPDLLPGRRVIVTGRPVQVAIDSQAGPLRLISDDGARSAALGQNDLLTLERVPRPGPDGPDTWRLRHPLGFAGELSVARRHLIFLAASPDAEPASEVATIAAIHHGSLTVLTLAEHLAGAYDRTTATISANVARATHGETVADEVLGSGDAARANQRFTLRQAPLTYVPAATDGGAASTLTVSVNGVVWSEAATLLDLGPTDQSYVLRRDETGRATLIFGDGRMGARPASGVENIRATYRAGGGLAGEVPSESLTVFRVRPPGVRAVANPLAAAGASAPERLLDDRWAAPRALLPLGRVVSLRDVEDFALGFPGVGKAHASWLWAGDRRAIRLVLAMASPRNHVPSAERLRDMAQAIHEISDLGWPLSVEPLVERRFGVRAALIVAPDRSTAEVLDAARRDLVDTFGFARRDFGQSVVASEVIAALQAVPGVIAVDLDVLILPPLPAGPATLLLINPEAVTLTTR